MASHPNNMQTQLAKVRVAGSNPVVRSKSWSDPISGSPGRAVVGEKRVQTLTLSGPQERPDMTATPIHPLVKSHLRAQERRWSKENRQNALSTLRRWTAFVADRNGIIDATADD